MSDERPAGLDVERTFPEVNERSAVGLSSPGPNQVEGLSENPNRRNMSLYWLPIGG
jgi:hypothetical protein